MSLSSTTTAAAVSMPSVFPRRRDADIRVEIDLVNRGFSALHNPRPVLFTLMDRSGTVTELPVPSADPRWWQPFSPADAGRETLVHKIVWAGRLPVGVQPGWYQVGLWLPDAAEALRLDPRYAVRVANRDVPWWTDLHGRYGVNLLGMIEVASRDA